MNNLQKVNAVLLVLNKQKCLCIVGGEDGTTKHNQLSGRVFIYSYMLGFAKPVYIFPCFNHLSVYSHLPDHQPLNWNELKEIPDEVFNEE